MKLKILSINSDSKRMQRLHAAFSKIKAISYKEVLAILKNNLDQQPLPQVIEDLQITKSAHDYVRGKEYFH